MYISIAKYMRNPRRMLVELVVSDVVHMSHPRKTVRPATPSCRKAPAPASHQEARQMVPAQMWQEGPCTWLECNQSAQRRKHRICLCRSTLPAPEPWHAYGRHKACCTSSAKEGFLNPKHLRGQAAATNRSTRSARNCLSEHITVRRSGCFKRSGRRQQIGSRPKRAPTCTPYTGGSARIGGRICA